MAASNRTTGKADVAALAATVDLAELKTSLDLIWDSALLNRDVSDTVAVSSSDTIVNFTGYDTIVINTTISTNISVSGITEDEYKYLIINKNVGNSITFENADDISYNLVYNNSLATLIYQIVYKGGANITAVPLHKTLDYSAILTSASLLPGEWQEASLSSPWVANPNNSMRAGLWYRLDGTSYLDLEIAINRSLAGAALITTLPVGYRPIRVQMCTPITFVDNTVYGAIQIATNGQVTFFSYSGTQYPSYVSLVAKINLT